MPWQRIPAAGRSVWRELRRHGTLLPLPWGEMGARLVVGGRGGVLYWAREAGNPFICGPVLVAPKGCSGVDWVWVKTGARVHLGQLDLNGSLGRLYGGIGLAIDRPRVNLQVRSAPSLCVEAGEGTEEQVERVRDLASAVLAHYRLPGAVIRVRELIPAHVGLGSGTQLAMALGLAITRAYGLSVPLAELASITDREGSRSGIGVGVFSVGGVLVDGGKPLVDGRVAARHVPPVLCRLPFPAAWGLVLAIPRQRHRFWGEREDRAFRSLPPMDERLASSLCRVALMRLLPALVEENLSEFGRAVTALQRAVGDYFAPVQGGRFFGPSTPIIDFLLARGAAGAGQSSWGPTVYGFCTREQVAKLVEEVQEFVGGEAVVFSASGVNHGARWGRFRVRENSLPA